MRKRNVIFFSSKNGDFVTFAFDLKLETNESQSKARCHPPVYKFKVYVCASLNYVCSLVFFWLVVQLAAIYAAVTPSIHPLNFHQCLYAQNHCDRVFFFACHVNEGRKKSH